MRAFGARAGGGVRTRIVDAERREDADVALREHLDLAGTGHRGLEGGNLLEERKGDKGLRHHFDCDTVRGWSCILMRGQWE